MVIHEFNDLVACHLGVGCAVVYECLCHRLRPCITWNTNFHDGLHWTPATAKELKVEMPYFSGQKISRTLKKLEESGYIKRGYYNDSPFDRSSWYACPALEEEAREEKNETGSNL